MSYNVMEGVITMRKTLFAAALAMLLIFSVGFAESYSLDDVLPWISTLNDEDLSTLINTATHEQTARIKAAQASSNAGEDYEITNEFFYTNEYGDAYYYCLVLKNNSGFNASIGVDVIFYDADNNIVGVESDDEGGCENGYETFWEFYNDTPFDHVTTEIVVDKDTRYRDGSQSSIDVTSNVSGNKIILSAHNHGGYPVEFVEYHVLFFDENGKLITTSWGYLDDKDSEIKPNKTVMADVECPDSFADYIVYSHGKID